MEFFINVYTNALLALTKAKCSAEFNFVTKIILANKLLKTFYNLT